ncbi:hypothetical protein AAW28_02405 [Lacticaseibacillus casei]|nr:hypothetical protein AAW28_02405 [Lacticaseibacillus casei]
MIDDMRKQLKVAPPRTYKRNVQKEWTNYSRHLKQQRKHRRTIIQHQLQYVKRDLRYVEDRFVSLDQPFIRPIKRGKAKNPTEFGPKIDLSMAGGILELEKFDFNNFN